MHFLRAGRSHLLSHVAAFALAASLPVAAQVPMVTFAGETMRLQSAAVAAAPGGGFDVTLQMQDDNGNTSLPNSWRRWWHCEVSNLTAGTTLNFRVTNAGYSDVILPVWSLSADGSSFGSYARMPTSAVPNVVGSSQHRFSVVVPAGVVAMRIAKFFPYTVTRKTAFLQGLAGEPRVRSIQSLGLSQQGRTIERVELTDSSVPDVGKQRVWIHSGVHPAETTSYFVVEGFVEWLRSGDPYAEVLLDEALIDLVPMANPDGVVLGNYRTNANSVEIESQWSAPYNSTQPEVVALRTAIEARMGTAQNPAANPIRVLLNLHSSHNVAFPFHFQHVANSNWSPGCTSCGVIPIVNQVEGQWIANFENHSQLVALGSTLNSTLGSRPFVESMCHDRWTAQNGWLNAPNFEEPVMAITFEGTYGRGPDGVTWSTEQDYRDVGAAMGRALFDQLGLSLSATAVSYGGPCVSVTLSGSLALQPNASHIASLSLASGAPGGLAVLVVGAAQVLVPLPQPWSSCSLLASPDATAVLSLDAVGAASLPLTVPPIPGLVAYLQAVSLDASLSLDASNGLRIANGY